VDEGIEKAFRDTKMVRTIAETALTMPVQEQNNPPELHFWAGAAHRPGVTRHLEHNGVPFTADTF